MGIEPILFLTKSFPLAHNYPVSEEIYLYAITMSFECEKSEKVCRNLGLQHRRSHLMLLFNLSQIWDTEL